MNGKRIEETSESDHASGNRDNTISIVLSLLYEKPARATAKTSRFVCSQRATPFAADRFRVIVRRPGPRACDSHRDALTVTGRRPVTGPATPAPNRGTGSGRGREGGERTRPTPPLPARTFMYSWTVFMPRIGWPTWLSMLPADTTRANAGSFISSSSCGRHFFSSLRSTLVPNLMVLWPRFCPSRWYLENESRESESESRCAAAVVLLSCSSCWAG